MTIEIDAAAPGWEGIGDALLESPAVGVVVCDRELRYLFWNRFMEELTGLAADVVLGRNALEIYPHLREEGLERVIERVLEGETVTAPDAPYRIPGSGRAGWVSAQYSPRRGADGEVAGVVGILHDVTQRKRAEEESRRLAALVRESPGPVLECDRAGLLTFANAATERLRAQLGATTDGLLPANHRALAAWALEKGRIFPDIEVEAGGRTLAWTYHPHPALGVVHLFAADVTERRAVEARLRHDALHDPLTGLPNRTLFLQRLAAADHHARHRPGYLFAVLFLDLDRFKLVNDSLGHHVGDDLLAAVAERLRACAGDGDTVARLGGDEFAVLLDDLADARAAVRAAERVHASLARPVRLGSYEVFTSASIGIALSTGGHGAPEHLLRNADVAMYRAKAAGTGRHEMFDRAMHALVLDRLRLETDLRRALEREEFALRYQPIVSLATGAVAGFEALIRWNHPERGWVGPGEFVPTAEETGLILGMGRWALGRACRQLREWREAGSPAGRLAVSVNVSVRQFAQPDLVEQVRAAVAAGGIDPRLLRLEVTESLVVENVAATAATLAKIRSLGVRIYMDDFGTGYSSLATLHRLPLDALKVDRAFVAGIGAEPGAAVVVRTVAALARSLALATVAEGVETPAQLAELRALECEYAQGYLFAPPLMPEEVPDFVASGRRW